MTRKKLEREKDDNYKINLKDNKLLYYNYDNYKYYNYNFLFQSRNNMLYVCPNCQNSFTDLDVDRLLDPVEQVLKYGS